MMYFDGLETMKKDDDGYVKKLKSSIVPSQMCKRSIRKTEHDEARTEHPITKQLSVKFSTERGSNNGKEKDEQRSTATVMFKSGFSQTILIIPKHKDIMTI